MKFIRRPDLTPQTRIHIVMLAWLNQGVYGKMTQIAKAYRISRTLLYQLLLAATVQLEELFSEQHWMPSPVAPLEPLALLLRLEGNCSIASISAIFKHLGYQPNSVGHLSAYFHSYGQGLPLWFVSYHGGFPPDNVAQIPSKPLSIQHNDQKGSAT